MIFREREGVVPNSAGSVRLPGGVGRRVLGGEAEAAAAALVPAVEQRLLLGRRHARAPAAPPGRRFCPQRPAEEDDVVEQVPCPSHQSVHTGSLIEGNWL